MTKKVVLKLGLHHKKGKKKAMKAMKKVLLGISGVESISLDTKDMKLTVIGDVDPVKIVSKLRKLCHTEIITVELAEEPGYVLNQEDPKKQEGCCCCCCSCLCICIKSCWSCFGTCIDCFTLCNCE